MNDLRNKSDEELEAIIRRAENTNVPGSLFQCAKIELELRDRKRGKNQEEILKLTPEFHGLAVNLRLLGKKITELWRQLIIKGKK